MRSLHIGCSHSLNLKVYATRFYSTIRWCYAEDVPLRNLQWPDWKSSKSASRFVPFSATDSEKLERAFQKSKLQSHTCPQEEKIANIPVTVSNESLHEVDLFRRELCAVYWTGPTYEVRRGVWFVQDGTRLVPCTEKTSDEIEELYLSFGGQGDDLRSTKSEITNPKHVSRKELLQLQTNPKLSIRFSNDLCVAWLYPNDGIFSIMRTLALHQYDILPAGSRVVRGYSQIVSGRKDQVSNVGGDIPKDTSTTQGAEADWISKIIDTIAPGLDYVSQSTPLKQSSIVAEQEKPVDHLVLCVHGIGQQLGRTVESVNFVKDINGFREVLRRTAKEDSQFHNLNFQILPVLWRHELSFKMTRQEQLILKPDRSQELTLADISLPSLQKFRSLIGDVILDVFLYHELHYRREILGSAIYQLNKTYREFCARHPNSFAKNPKVSLIGHSLGSVICFDILCKHESRDWSLHPWLDSLMSFPPQEISRERLEFDVVNFLGLGSPVGLFELLRGRRVGRKTSSLIDSPAVQNYFNLFHPMDPVAYRFEPLITLAASQLDPALAPYPRGGITNQVNQIRDTASSAVDRIYNLIPRYAPALSSPLGINTEPLESRPSGKLISHISQESRDELHHILSQFNSQGRLDYSLQEGVLDLSLVDTLASHISYFGKQEVAEFVLRAISGLSVTKAAI